MYEPTGTAEGLCVRVLRDAPPPPPPSESSRCCDCEDDASGPARMELPDLRLTGSCVIAGPPSSFVCPAEITVYAIAEAPDVAETEWGTLGPPPPPAPPTPPPATPSWPRMRRLADAAAIERGFGMREPAEAAPPSLLACIPARSASGGCGDAEGEPSVLPWEDKGRGEPRADAPEPEEKRSDPGGSTWRPYSATSPDGAAIGRNAGSAPRRASGEGPDPLPPAPLAPPLACCATPPPPPPPPP
jgi:hypothetical protein